MTENSTFYLDVTPTMTANSHSTPNATTALTPDMVLTSTSQAP